MTRSPKRSKITITADQRDALYAAVTLDLSAIDGVALAIQRGDLLEADRLTVDFMADLQLVRDDLGWGKRGRDVELSSPPEVLRSVMSRMRERAEEEEREESEEYAELEQHLRKSRLVQETCSRVLRALESA